MKIALNSLQITEKQANIMPKIYDTFSFFNELDMLEIRLNVLDAYVDYFVIIEANTTWTGEAKPLFYALNKERYKKWEHKIIHYVVPDFPTDKDLYTRAIKSPNVGAGAECWVREFYYKESNVRPLQQCSDDDIIFVSDVDEIWHPKCASISVLNEKVYRPIQTSYLFYLNNCSNLDISNWTGTRFGTYKTLKQYGPNHFRTERVIKGIPIENGGWHFTWLINGLDKLKVDTHAEQQIMLRYETARRAKTWIDEANLPEFILKNKNLYKEKRMML